MRSEIDEAIALLKLGGDGGLDRAVDLLQGAVFAFSMRVCGQEQDAEDTMQEVLVKSLPYLSKFDNSRALATWLYKVAKNRCLTNRRKSTFAPKEELSLEALMPNQAEFERLDGLTSITPEGSAISGEQGQRLREAIRYCHPTIASFSYSVTWKASQRKRSGRSPACAQGPYVSDSTGHAYSCGGNSRR